MTEIKPCASYSERAFAGPDYWGRTFQAEPCQHVAEWIERQRLDRLRRDAAEAMRERRAIARLSPVTTPVADISDAAAFPEIAAAVQHARQLAREASQ